MMLVFWPQLKTDLALHGHFWMNLLNSEYVQTSVKVGFESEYDHVYNHFLGN